MKTLAIIFATLLFFGNTSNAAATDKGKDKNVTPKVTLRTEILTLIEADAQEEVNRTLTFDIAEIDSECITNLIDQDAKAEAHQALELAKPCKITGAMATLFERNATEQTNSNLVEKTVAVEYLADLIEQNAAQAEKTNLK